MPDWLAFRIRARGKSFADALAAFKAAVPSTSRRWDGEHRCWVFDPEYKAAVSAIGDVKAATTWAEDDRLHGRNPVAEDEQLDTDLIDRQYADLAEVNASLPPSATADEVAATHPKWFAGHPSPLLPVIREVEQ
jgi:hypothetical protein